MSGVGCLHCDNQIKFVDKIHLDCYFKCEGCQQILGSYRVTCCGKKKHQFITCYTCKELLIKPRSEVKNWWSPWTSDSL
jgi:hypothetical protein